MNKKQSTTLDHLMLTSRALVNAKQQGLLSHAISPTPSMRLLLDMIDLVMRMVTQEIRSIEDKENNRVKTLLNKRI